MSEFDFDLDHLDFDGAEKKTAQQQLAAVANFLDGRASLMDRLPRVAAQPVLETLA